MTTPQKTDDAPATGVSRRQFLQNGLRGLAVAAVGAITGLAASRSSRSSHVWQLDPAKCVQCGRCETACVLTPS